MAGIHPGGVSSPPPLFSRVCIFSLEGIFDFVMLACRFWTGGLGWGRQRKGQVTGPWPVSLEVIEVREVEEAAWVNCDLSGGLSQNPISPPGTPPCRDTDVATSHSKQTLLVRVALVHLVERRRGDRRLERPRLRPHRREQPLVSLYDAFKGTRCLH